MKKDFEPDYHCPVRGEASEMIIGPEQAFCTNTEGCRVISFNPSLPDGGMSNVRIIEFEMEDDHE